MRVIEEELKSGGCLKQVGCDLICRLCGEVLTIEVTGKASLRRIDGALHACDERTDASIFCGCRRGLAWVEYQTDRSTLIWS